MYKEVEKRPAVGNDDLSLHNITVGSTLFNTQSKCLSVFAIIKNKVFELLIWFKNPHLLRLLPPDEICPLPVQIPVVKPDPDRANPKIGVSSLAFSSDSRYLATKNGKYSQLFIVTFIVNPTELYNIK